MKKRITTFTIILSIIVSLISIPTSVRAKLKEVPEKEYADMPQAFKQLDLTAVANRGFADDVAGDGKGGWTGSNAMTSAVSLYMFCCENPKPSKKVSKIIAETTGKGSYLMLVVALYDDKDVLIGTELVKKTLSTAEPYIQTEEFSTKGVKTIRTFLWDSGDIKPYFSSETFKAASEADD